MTNDGYGGFRQIQPPGNKTFSTAREGQIPGLLYSSFFLGASINNRQFQQTKFFCYREKHYLCDGFTGLPASLDGLPVRSDSIQVVFSGGLVKFDSILAVFGGGLVKFDSILTVFGGGLVKFGGILAGFGGGSVDFGGELARVGDGAFVFGGLPASF
jgi:hypothetical protein